MKNFKMDRKDLRFSGNGKISWVEFVFAILGTAGMFDIIYGVNFFISTFYSAVMFQIVCLFMILVSGNKNFKRMKFVSGLELVGAVFIMVIIFLYGYLDLDFIQSNSSRLVAMFLTIATYYSIAMRD